jgi:hypothetical protein
LTMSSLFVVCRNGRKRIRILWKGFEAYLENLVEVWGDPVHHNGWLRIELRITTSHALDWRELHFGCVNFIRDVGLT